MDANHLLYRDFPIEISRPYKEVVQAADWGTRHAGLLGLAEAALFFLASLSLSEYRTRSAAPVRNIEVLLERYRSRKLTVGRVCELFRDSAVAVDDPLVPGPKLFPGCELECLARFAAVMDALQAAVDGLREDASPAEVDIAFHAGRDAPEQVAEIGWWEGWERLVRYRNKVVHFQAERWPIHGRGYWDAMGPLLHDSLVELLTHPQVADAILSHPVFGLTKIEENGSGGFVHSLCGENRGLYCECDVVEEERVTDRWAEEHWKASASSSFVLEQNGAGEWSIRSLFWDLRTGVPPVMDMGVADSVAKPISRSLARAPSSPPAAKEGKGIAPGTCGEFAQGLLPDGTPFHVTCPINKSATVAASLRPGETLTILGLGEHHRKLELAIRYAADLLDLGATEITIRHWTDLDIGKGMGSSTADVLAGIRALARAVGEQLDPPTEGRLAARVESSDGSMYPGIAAVNHKTCEVVKAWDWFPEFVIVMLVPTDSVETASIRFLGQQSLAADYGDLLAAMDDAVARRSIADFAAQSTVSAALNEEFLSNPYAQNLSGRLDEFEALGLNVGHTGTVCGLLFPNTDEGRKKSSEACLAVRREFVDLKDVKVVTTPHRRGVVEGVS